MANKYFRTPLTPPSGTETLLYAVPAANSTVASSLRITNRSIMRTELTMKVYPSGGATSYHLLKGYILPQNQTMDALSGVSLVLQEGDLLKVTSSQADVDFYLSYLEMDRS